MRGWLRSHLTYANVIATLALFLVLSGGTAVALTGSNTVFSDDIVNDQVYSGDVRNDTLSGGGLAAADLRANSVGQSEVAAEAIANPKLGANAVTGPKVLDDSLTGTDIDESTLGEVPSATLGGLGGQSGGTASCDPESNVPVTCGSVDVTLPAPARVLVIGQIRAEPDTGGGNGGGSCQVNGTEGFSKAPVFVNGGQTDVITISGVTVVLGPGSFSFRIECNETASGIRYFNGHVSFVALSPGG